MNRKGFNLPKFGKLFIYFSAALSFSGCDVDGVIDPFLYGPKCDGANEIGHCKQDEYCEDGACHLAGGLCKGATVNTNGFEYCLPKFECDADKKACVFIGGCFEDSDCREGMYCSDNRCVCATPSGELACADNEACCEGFGCVNLNTSSSNCSACGQACGGGERCEAGQCIVTCASDQDYCDETCVNLKLSREHCGACGNQCEEGRVCNNGQCELSCQTGYTICDGKCVNLMLDRNNCGACGDACGDGEVCLGNGTCGLSCQTGLDVCDGWCVNLQSDTSNCGSCGNQCKGGMICKNGECSENCIDGLEKCSGTCVDTRYDNSNCGACGIICQGNEVCNNGICDLFCASGLTNCNGACTDLQTDNGNCGTCGNACSDGQICNNGACASECEDGLTKCGYSCVDLQSNVSSCGACDVICSASQFCSAGKCIQSCPSGQTDCDSLCVNLNSNSKNCGACGNACQAGYVCRQGNCLLSCPEKYTNCNEKCTDLQNDLENCGSCGHACQQGETCTDGECKIYCPETRTLCGNACYDLSTDFNNCGECGHACSENQMCVNGECAEVCSGTTIKCLSQEETEETPAAYTCADPKVNNVYCGCTEESVGQNCDSNVETELGFCSEGACVRICNSGYYDCGMLGGLNCVDLQTDPMNCGSCENQCMDGQSCVGGECVCTAEGYVSVELDGERICAIELKSADDLVKLRDAIRAGDLSQAPGAPSDMTEAVYAISTSIDLGTQEDWRGIGTENMPFAGTLVGKEGAVVSGTLNCATGYCGFFGRVNGARIDSLNFKLTVNSTQSNIGRFAGLIDNSKVTNLRVDGELNSTGIVGGGVAAVVKNSTCDNVVCLGVFNASPDSNFNGKGYYGGVYGQCTNSILSNQYGYIDVYSGSDRVGGIAGRSTNTKFLNNTYIGTVRRSGSGSKPSRVGGIVGQTGKVMIANALVVASLIGRDAVGGIIGINAESGSSTIRNSAVISNIEGASYVGGGMGYEQTSSSSIKNSVFISKVRGSSSQNSICGTGSISSAMDYYDSALSSTVGSSCTASKITYTEEGVPYCADTEKSVTESLNGALECNEETNICIMDNGNTIALPWNDIKLNTEKLLGQDYVVPWQRKELTDDEINAMVHLNSLLGGN